MLNPFMKSTMSSTLIDVMIHNNNLITDSKVIGCPFSDHKFNVGSIKLDHCKREPQIFYYSGNLSETNL